MKAKTSGRAGRGRRRWWIALGVGLVGAWVPFGCSSMGPPSTKHAFDGRPAPVLASVVLPGGERVAYAETGNASGPLVVCVHGTPGSWSSFSFVMADAALAKRARVVSVDRPGWGGSAGGGLRTSMAEQAAALRAVVLAHPGNRPVVVVGHSLGGPVAARFAMDSPDLVAGLILVAGSIDPEMEETSWYQAVGRWSLVRWAVPKALVNADREIVPLKAELEAMRPQWAGLRMPVTVVQGMKDSLVPAENAAFAERMITGAPVTTIRIPAQGHLIPWERPDIVIAAVQKQLDGLEAAAGKAGK